LKENVEILKIEWGIGKMSDTYSSWGGRENFSIEDSADCRGKIKLYYPKWEESGLSEEWLKSFEKNWLPSRYIWDFIDLMKAKRDLSE
jgi:hypothetical protein